MSVISVCPDRLEKESASIIQLAQTLRDYNKTVSSISVRLSMKIVAQRRLDLMLKEASEQILSEAAKMETFGGALAQIARKYKETETKLTSLCNDKFVAQSQESEQINQLLQTIKENLRSALVQLGLIKAEKQERVEGEPVTQRQEREMDLYMRNEATKLRKEERFSEKTWKKASLEERKEILQEYISRISGIMGLPPVTIQWDYKESENGYVTMGYYSQNGDVVAINEWVLSEGDKNGFLSYDLVSTVAHEMRHYYQREAVRHPEKYVVTADTIQKWEESFNNYRSQEDFMVDYGMSSSEAFRAYQDQAVEVDARWFEGKK